ncbi:MAG: aminotransferase class III-fold pyridoxal phosphate-dependent enzyme [Thermomicrobiales bacterium]
MKADTWPSQRWLQEVRAICDEHGIMLILDEIQTGVGRTGAMWGFEHFGVTRHHDGRQGHRFRTAGQRGGRQQGDDGQVASRRHGGTYGANAVGTAAAAETLRVMRDERLPENAAAIGSVLSQGLRAIQAKYPVIGEVRGLGLMLAVEFVDSQGDPNPGAVSKVIASCLAENVLLINCGTYDQAIRVIPPLVIDEQQANEFLAVFENAVAAL